MDSEAVTPERDRSSPADEAEPEERSRSVVRVSAAGREDGEAGADPGADADSRPGAEADSPLGAEAGPRPGAEASSRPGGEAPSLPGTGGDPGAEAGPGLPGPAGWWAAWRRTVLLGLGCVAALLLITHFVVEPFQVPSTSMEGTLRVGDRILVNKLAYRFGGAPHRGDVIVFDGRGSFDRDGGTDYVKRVIGVGGDRVTCCDRQGRLMVNGHPLEETYLHPGDLPSRVPFDIVVPEGRLWVMGDHRDDSRDSRDHLGEPGGGTVPVGRVIGRAEWVAWPLGHWTRLNRPAAFAAVPAPSAGRHG